MQITLAPNEFLDDYVLGAQLAKNAGISQTPTSFGKMRSALNLKTRASFLLEKRASQRNLQVLYKLARH